MMWRYFATSHHFACRATSGGTALDAHGLHNAQGVNLLPAWLRIPSKATQVLRRGPTRPNHRSPLPVLARSKFSVQTFTQPFDHFYNTTDATYQQRFWINTRHYKPRSGAPVTVIDRGKIDRLPFLESGHGHREHFILARATGGTGVVLEHRYYDANPWSRRICGCSELLDRCHKVVKQRASQTVNLWCAQPPQHLCRHHSIIATNGWPITSEMM